MCKFLTNKHAGEFRPVSRSIRIHGHSTSLRLEACFWRALDDLARDEGLSTPKLIETLHAEASSMLHDGRRRRAQPRVDPAQRLSVDAARAARFGGARD